MRKCLYFVYIFMVELPVRIAKKLVQFKPGMSECDFQKLFKILAHNNNNKSVEWTECSLIMDSLLSKVANWMYAFVKDYIKLLPTLRLQVWVLQLHNRCKISVLRRTKQILQAALQIILFIAKLIINAKLVDYWC